MGENGVSHYVVNDDLEGVKVILRWLSYCPAQLGAEPPLLPTNDPVDRTVSYEPAAHEKFDPRAAIMGEREARAGLLTAVQATVQRTPAVPFAPMPTACLSRHAGWVIDAAWEEVHSCLWPPFIYCTYTHIIEIIVGC
jgi:hypothetical protein